MKKKILFSMTLVATLALTMACSAPKKESSKKTKTDDKSRVVANDTKNLPAIAENTMNVTEITTGNLTSLAGVWKNDSSGAELVFDHGGLVSTTSEFKSEFELKETIIQVAYGEKGKEDAGYKLLMIPAGTTIPQEYFAEDNEGDTSDDNRDRMLIMKDPLTSFFEVYYKVAVKE